MYFNFAALPPETNSAYLYDGAGPKTLYAAAEEWKEYTFTAMSCTLTSFDRAVGSLQGEWSGPSALRMAEAAASYRTWMTAFILNIRSTGTQASRLMDAYSGAKDAMVHPDEIAWNRYRVAELRHHGMFGEYAEKIAELEEEYQQLWVKAAKVMETYAVTVLDELSQLTAWEQPPEIADEVGVVQENVGG